MLKFSGFSDLTSCHELKYLGQVPHGVEPGNSIGKQQVLNGVEPLIKLLANG